MRIIDLLKKEAVVLGTSAASKEEAINKLISLHEKAGNLTDVEQYKKDILAREAQGTTAIGEGIAVPHAKSTAVKAPALAAITVPDGVDYDAPDGKPAKLLFMIAATTDGNVHLEILSRLMVMLMEPAFAESLMQAKDTEEFLRLIDEKETEKYPVGADAEAKEQPKPAKKEGYQILAVTACPTGIAHTYMAAEALEKKAAEMGVSIKVETNGSGGAKNVLTDSEIEAAQGIIIAADKNVEMARFDGKPVLSVKVSDGIHKPEELIQKVQNGEAPIYHHSGEKAEKSTGEKESFGRRIYKDLMNGVSNMLPFVTGGGILIALAFLFDDYSIDPSNFGMNTPFAAFLKTVGNTAFGFMLPILAGFIAKSIADRPGLVVGFVGGAIANLGISFTNMDSSTAVSAGFLGALIAGFAAGYLVKGLEKLCDYLPKSFEGIKPVLIYPLVGVFLIGVVMFAINPAVSAINTAITNFLNSMGDVSKVVLGCILGGMMSVDMGGPINKAAYVFGTAAIANGNFDIMAAVMVGGMIPPLVIALCATFFRKKFTASDRKSAYVNYIMGLCFISEGAIPFAAADPLRVIPSCIVGSAVAGGLSMAFGCTLRAPHGGIFVFPVVEHVGGYLVALVVGSVVGMLLLALLKKNVKEEA